MARRVASTKRATIYRFTDGTDLLDGIREKFRESTAHSQVHEVTVDTMDGILIVGSAESTCKWLGDIALLTGKTGLKLVNKTPGAVLVLREGEGPTWAITWGLGFHFLESERVDFRFGSRIVARSAFPDDLRSITRTILDHRSRVDRSSQPGGGTMRDLGMDEYGEVVNRIEARAMIDDLTIGDKEIHLRAADSLQLPLAKSPSSLVHDLGVLDAMLSAEPLPGLEGIEQLVALRSRDPLVEVLDAKLVRALVDRNADGLGISWPHERLEQWAPFGSCKVSGIGDRALRVLDAAPEIEDVFEWLAAIPEADIRQRLQNARLEIYSDNPPVNGTQAAMPVSLKRWLAFETHIDEHRYCLHAGSWYRMDDQYLDRIDRRVREILDERTSLAMPSWPASENEGPYNLRAAKLLGGYTLDKKLIKTPLHARGGIEPCDIFIPDGTLVHVKRGSSSSALSHLLAQALVSTDALARDDNGRVAWRKRVTEISKGKVTNPGLDEVVLAIGRPKPITVDTMFTFTKVNLVRQYDALKYNDVRVKLVTIPEK